MMLVGRDTPVMKQTKFEVSPINKDDHGWVSDALKARWGSTRIVSRGAIHNADKLPGLMATVEGKPVGLVTYELFNNECEVISLDSFVEGIGIGSALIKGVKDISASAGCRRLWLITTNDNTKALRFYQRRGFSIAAVYRNVVERSRELKPEIPLIGINGIPVRDEIELEMLL